MAVTLTTDAGSYAETVTLVLEECPTCGIVFGLPRNWLNNSRRRGKSIYCPNGHTFWYGESEEDKLSRALKEAQDKLAARTSHLDRTQAELESMQRRYAAQRGATTRLKNRLRAGQCPACALIFEDLGDHMAAVHPTFNREEEDDR
jgi:Zn-finger nucleic acid-binding protein